MLDRESGVGEHVLLGFVHQLRKSGKSGAKAVCDSTPLLAGAPCVGLWAKTVRMVAPTICWVPLSTSERAFLMKCTLHLYHEAPTNTASTALFKSL